MSCLGLDIGGANLKIADGEGYAHSVPFPLWQKPGELSSALRGLLAQSPPLDSLAVTMTGELADCFQSKADGVNCILDAVVQVAGQRNVQVYLCNGCFVSVSVARGEAMLAAASNWVVLANYVGRYCSIGSALLLDLGSTTCDIIPIRDSCPASSGMTDTERLAAGELVYTGVRRSPVCAIVSELPWRDRSCRVAQELFATSQDAYLLLGLMAENPNCFDTADGRSSTRKHAHGRLARAVCADTMMFSLDDAELAAKAIHCAQLDLLETAARQVMSQMNELPATIAISGEGEFLIHQLIERLQLTGEGVSLGEKLGPEVSQSACAHALAVLANERAIS